MKSPHSRTGRSRLLVALTALLLAGCASVELPPPVFDGSARDALGVDDAALLEPPDPFLLGPEARAWLHRQIPGNRDRHARLAALVELFGSEGPMEIRYELTRSTDAQGTLDAREGNCLSFTILFVALARQLGLEARVQEVAIPASWSRLEDLAVAHRHVVAWGRLDGRAWEVDFGQFERPVGTPHRLLRDREVAAVLASNQGATALAAGGDGTEALRLAVGLVPDLAQGWTNLGVALARSGPAEGAEFAFRRALQVSPGDSSALSGLMRLYERHAPAAAQRLSELMPELLSRNPYYLYFAGLEAQRAGDLAAAEGLFRRALKAHPHEPWFHLALVRNRIAAGDASHAQGALRRARVRIEDDAQFALLVTELSRGTLAAMDAPELLTGPIEKKKIMEPL